MSSLLLCSLLLCALPTSSATTLAASSPLVLWQGRTRRGADSSVAFDWEGVSASFSTLNAQQLSLVVNASTLNAWCGGRVSVYINGYFTANLPVHASASRYVLSAGLQSAAHNVTVTWETEPGNSCTAAGDGSVMMFSSFDTGNENGSFVAPSPLPRFLEVVGDSISAMGQGDFNYAEPATCADAGVVNSQQWNWQRQLARALDANLSTVAWSGKGLVWNSNCGPGATMPELYLQTLGGDAASRWDFAKAVRPDAVVSFLGTNDCWCADYEDATFTAAYVAFLQNVTALYAASASGPPKSVFFLAVGPLQPTKPLNATLNAVATARAAGIEAHLLDMRDAAIDGCWGHPGALGHKQMAAQALPQIEAVMGWTRVRALG